MEDHIITPDKHGDEAVHKVYMEVIGAVDPDLAFTLLLMRRSRPYKGDPAVAVLHPALNEAIQILCASKDPRIGHSTWVNRLYG